MSAYSLKIVHRLPLNLASAWDFFSSPKNLKEITPAEMGFETLSNSDSEKMFPGQIITYNVRPVLGIPLFWMTEITHVKENEFFVDEQRIGPYKLWHHQHHFKAIDGGVEMTDIVHYQLPFGILGQIAHFLFVKKQLEGIFSYRTEVLKSKFGEL